MNVRELEALKNWLSNRGDLDNANTDLIEDAIWCTNNGCDYKAKFSLKVLAANLRRAGKEESAEEVESLL